MLNLQPGVLSSLCLEIQFASERKCLSFSFLGLFKDADLQVCSLDCHGFLSEERREKAIKQMTASLFKAVQDGSHVGVRQLVGDTIYGSEPPSAYA